MPKLLNKTNLPKYASAPSSPANGDIYYNTTDHIVYARINGAWVDLGAGGGGSGDITDVVAGNGLTGGASTGSATLDVGAGTGISVSPDAVAIDTAVVPVKTDNLGVFATSTSAAIGVGSIELGHATDTTITRSSAGVVSVEGVALVNTNDSRLTDARTPTAHATSHKSGGTDAIKLNEFAAPDADVSLNSQKITGLGTPSAGTDAATKAYVDGVAEGLDVKASCRLATTVADGNIGLSGLSNIDGVTPLAGDRILVKNQTTGSENGIYIADPGSWSRASDAAQFGEITPGTFVFVEEGSQADSGWVVTTNGTITIGATDITWSQFSGAGQITAGAGLTKSGNTLDVGAGTGISVAADSVGINTAVVPTISGANTVTFTAGAATALTLPASGTVATTSNKLSAFASTTSAELAGVISDETGSNKLVFSDSPTLVTPTLGVASATSVNKVAITAPATSATLTIADGKTLTASNTLTFTGTDASSVAFGSGGTVLYSGGALGTPSSGTLTNASGLPVSGITSSTTQALGVGSVELGHATDTTLARGSAGRLTVEGVNVVTISSTDTLTNKTISASSNTINGVAKVYYQTTQPAGASQGDIWVDQDDNTTVNSNNLTISQKAASYTLATDLSDAPDEVVEMNVATANTVSIPTDATANYPIGTQIHVFQFGAGQTTIQAVTPATTTVVGTPGLKLRAQYSFATLIKRAANYWIVVGDLAA